VIGYGWSTDPICQSIPSNEFNMPSKSSFLTHEISPNPDFTSWNPIVFNMFTIYFNIFYQLLQVTSSYFPSSHPILVSVLRGTSGWLQSEGLVPRRPGIRGLGLGGTGPEVLPRRLKTRPQGLQHLQQLTFSGKLLGFYRMILLESDGNFEKWSEHQ
jgi:hypothetical protein